MPDVVLAIGGHDYTVTCRPGGEDRLRELGRRVDEKVEIARASVGNASEIRQLLFATLLLADEVGPPPSDIALSSAIAALADRVEALADALESAAANA